MSLDSEIAKMLGEEPAEEEQEKPEEEKEESTAEGSEEEKGSEEESSEESESESSEEASSEESSEESEESEEDSELEKLRKQNEKLQKQLNQQASQNQVQPKESSESEESQSSDPLADVDPMSGHEFDTIMDDQEKFKQWAKDFGKTIYEKAKEDFYREVPSVIQSTTQEQITLRERAKQFYDENPDLSNVKDFVAQTTNQVHSEHPDWNFDDVLEEAANRSREALGLEKQAHKQEKDSKKKNPGLAKEGSSKKSGKRDNRDDRSEMEKEIDEMLKVHES